MEEERKAEESQVEIGAEGMGEAGEEPTHHPMAEDADGVEEDEVEEGMEEDKMEGEEVEEDKVEGEEAEECLCKEEEEDSRGNGH